MSFEAFNLDPKIMAGIVAAGYTTPTPIQEKAIPPVMQGRDLIGLAQTGTGKTAAFALPVLNNLMGKPRGKVGVLVVSPTRELAEQTHETFTQLGKATGLRSIAIYGGVGMQTQVDKLRRGVEIAVGCPGRLLDHLWKGTLDLSHLQILVIDEADRMFDMGFLPDIKSILQCLPEKRQTLLFSATMPDDIRKLVKEILHDPVTVQIGQGAPVSSVSHALYPVRQHLKTALLKALLDKTDTDSVLVFTRTKHRTERVVEQLRKDGYSVAGLQGNQSQPQRMASLAGFRDGTYKILIATDIAARGIDISTISHVINYDMPDTTDAYTHRIGRTGRVAKTGDAYTFVCDEDIPMVRSIEKILKTTIERRVVDGFDYAKAAPPRTEGSYDRGPRPAARPANGVGRSAPRRPGMATMNPYRPR